MSLEKRDLEMLAISVPLMDYWEMREELDHLKNSVDRLEKIVKMLVALYTEERTKNWELILREMMKEEERKKGNKDVRNK